MLIPCRYKLTICWYMIQSLETLRGSVAFEAAAGILASQSEECDVTGFTSAKGLIELTRYIVQNSSVLECMTLDTARGCGRRTAKTNKCEPMFEEGLKEAQKAVEL